MRDQRRWRAFEPRDRGRSIVISVVLTLLVAFGCTGDPAPAEDGQSRQAERRRMVETQIAARGVEDDRVLAAMGKVKRERYVPPAMRPQAYADHPLPIGYRQTISQPRSSRRDASHWPRQSWRGPWTAPSREHPWTESPTCSQ